LPECLPQKTREQGGWSATINVSAKGPQEQVDAPASYAIPLCETYTTKTEGVKTGKTQAVYRTSKEAEAPEPPCVGSPNEPIAEPGFTCFYRADQFGQKESEDKNAGFAVLQDFDGNVTVAGEEAGGLIGENVVFRTKEFNAEKPISEIVKFAQLTASGSWSVAPRE
jgi:hypothetical protein